MGVVLDSLRWPLAVTLLATALLKASSQPAVRRQTLLAEVARRSGLPLEQAWWALVFGEVALAVWLVSGIALVLGALVSAVFFMLATAYVAVAWKYPGGPRSCGCTGNARAAGPRALGRALSGFGVAATVLVGAIFTPRGNWHTASVTVGALEVFALCAWGAWWLAGAGGPLSPAAWYARLLIEITRTHLWRTDRIVRVIEASPFWRSLEKTGFVTSSASDVWRVRGLLLAEYRGEDPQSTVLLIVTGRRGWPYQVFRIREAEEGRMETRMYFESGGVVDRSGEPTVMVTGPSVTMKPRRAY